MHVGAEILCVYAAYAILMLSLPEWSDELAINFVLSEALIEKIRVANFVFKGSDQSYYSDSDSDIMNRKSARKKESDDQALAANVLQKNNVPLTAHHIQGEGLVKSLLISYVRPHACSR